MARPVAREPRANQAVAPGLNSPDDFFGGAWDRVLRTEPEPQVRSWVCVADEEPLVHDVLRVVQQPGHLLPENGVLELGGVWTLT